MIRLGMPFRSPPPLAPRDDEIVNGIEWNEMPFDPARQPAPAYRKQCYRYDDTGQGPHLSQGEARNKTCC
jgi:hypothetical protein